MQFTIKVRNDRDGREWNEEYNKPEVCNQATAEKKGRELVAYFNDTLRPHESSRTFLFATFGDGSALQSHDWQKSNLVTIMGKRGSSHDTAKCSRCGITGKRFGLGNDVVRDSKFKAKGYASCDTAQVLLARRAHKRSEDAEP